MAFLIGTLSYIVSLPSSRDRQDTYKALDIRPYTIVLRSIQNGRYLGSRKVFIHPV